MTRPHGSPAAAEPWAADVEIDAAVASASIACQFPELAGLEVEPYGEGWDNAAYLVGGKYVFRFPRRAVAVDLIETEIRVLPAIAARVPLAIPIPRFVGVADVDFPRPFAGYVRVRGEVLSAVRLDERALEAAAVACGEFLRALHAIDPSALPPPLLAGDRIGRLDHAVLMPRLRERFAELHAAGLLPDPARFVRFLERVAPSGPRADRLVVVHGDLYARHILVESAGDRGYAVSGIIDWGDVHCGDPAIDIAAAFEVFPARCRAAFAGAYGRIDDETWALARYRAVYHSALVAHYGRRIGDEDLVAAGLAGLSDCADLP